MTTILPLCNLRVATRPLLHLIMGRFRKAEDGLAIASALYELEEQVVRGLSRVTMKLFDCFKVCGAFFDSINGC
jgi:hypothetical protein